VSRVRKRKKGVLGGGTGQKGGPPQEVDNPAVRVLTRNNVPSLKFDWEGWESDTKTKKRGKKGARKAGPWVLTSFKARRGLKERRPTQKK